MTKAKRDYYIILGISKDASSEEIKKAYRKLAHKYHPDRNQEADAINKFKEVSEAYEILSDSNKRQNYDHFGHDGIKQQNINNSNPFDIFHDFFHGGRPRKGHDIHIEAKIELEDVLHGKTHRLSFPRKIQCHTCKGAGGSGNKCTPCGGYGQMQQQNGFMRMVTTCPHCRGSGIKITNKCNECRGKGYINKTHNIDLPIPAGVSNGIHIKIVGEGEITSLKLPPGDVICNIRVNPHKLFIQQGKNLLFVQTISFVDACLGIKIQIPTLDGKPEKLKIPPGTQIGNVFKIAQKGVPGLNRSMATKRGDLLIEMRIDIPRNLSDEAKNILKQFDEKIKEHKE